MEDNVAFLLNHGMTLDEIDRLHNKEGLSFDEIRAAAEYLVERGENISAEVKEDDAPKLATVSATELQHADLPPVVFRIVGLISNGLTLICSPPKFGKSWLVLYMCLCIAFGRAFLGYATNKCGCLYLALEDSKQRLKARMNQLLSGEPAPAGFDFATTCSTMDNGLFDELTQYLAGHPDTGVIVIDTLQRVRGASHGRNAYADDYREMSALKVFADTHGIALVLVHHLRKMGDDGDPFARISGTNGVLGAADTAIVMSREKRSDENTTMSITGRDVEADEIELEFDKDTGRWVNLGSVDDVAEQRAQAEYANSPLVRTIKKLLEGKTEWSGTAQQIIEAGRYIARTQLASSPRELSSKLKSLDDLMFRIDGIAHERVQNGTGGGKHRFRYVDATTFEEAEQDEIPVF